MSMQRKSTETIFSVREIPFISRYVSASGFLQLPINNPLPPNAHRPLRRLSFVQKIRSKQLSDAHTEIIVEHQHFATGNHAAVDVDVDRITG